MAANTYHLLELAERAEALSAEVYAALAERFAEDAEARALFMRLRAEEVQHASRIRLLAARYRHDSSLLGNITMQISELEGLLRAGETAIAEDPRRQVAGRPRRVKARLVLFEERFTRAHAEFISISGHDAVRDFFEQLAEQDDGHAELLGHARRRGRRVRRPR